MRSYNSDFRKKSTITPTRSLQAPTIISRCRHALKVPSNILFRGDSGSGLICFGAASSSPHATSHHPRDVIPSRPPQGHPLSQLTALSAHGWRIASVRGPAKISCSISTHRSHPRLRTSSGVVAGASPPASTPSTSAGDGSHKPAAGPKLAFFVSGGGSNFKAIHTAILEGHFFAHVAVVVSDVPTCRGLHYAQSLGIPTLIYPGSKKGGFEGLTSEQLVQALKVEHKVDFVILAGYLKLIPALLVASYPRAMLNIHPGLLPSFGGKGMYGERVHQAVVASGARFSGPTVHFVDEEFDTGAILAQRVVPVYPTDTPKKLAARVLKEEHLVYPEAVAALVEGRITWREDGVPIMWSAH